MLHTMSFLQSWSCWSWRPFCFSLYVCPQCLSGCFRSRHYLSRQLQVLFTSSFSKTNSKIIFNLQSIPSLYFNTFLLINLFHQNIKIFITDFKLLKSLLKFTNQTFSIHSQSMTSEIQPNNSTIARLKEISYIYDKIKEHPINVSSLTPEYGEIFISNKQNNGALELIPESKGKLILNISGGKKKIFLFQQLTDDEHVVTAIHPESEDFIEYNGQSTLPIDEIVQSLEGHKISQIKCGQLHNVILTTDGSVFSFGKNTFGSLGLSGKIFMPSPQRITKLQNKKIVSVACGFYHSLALSDIGDVYSWGRGFEGQLGLLKQIQTASSPQYITNFFKYDTTSKDGVRMLKKKPISFIACGASHSMAIDTEGNLYCWGEARFGQTGNGKKTKEPFPVHVKLQSQNAEKKAVKVDGGLGHTLCLTTDGTLFSWGLNIKGQLGLNDLPQGIKGANKSLEYVKAAYFPVQLKVDRKQQKLPKFKQISCGFCTSFGIDEQGNAWCWGGGALGFKDKFSERGPTMLTQNVQSRKFSKVFANEDSLVLFAPLQLQFFKPNLVPSSGGSQVTFFGYGFTDTGFQSARFLINGNLVEQVDIQYDDKTSTYYCRTPEFERKGMNNISYPIECEIELSLDKGRYYAFEKKLLVYSSKLSIQTCDPKIGSAHGVGNLSIYLPLDNLTLSYIDSITVGFKNNTKVEEERSMKDWICSEGHYKENNISCKLPNIPQFDNDNPFYLVDVSLNGQEFTDHPQTFRFYWINQTSLTPNEGFQEGDYQVVINGKGLFESQSKQLKLILNFKHNQTPYECQREVELIWNKNDKNFKFKMPSLAWLIGDHVISPELLESARKQPVLVKLFYSKKDSIDIGSFRYLVPPPPPEPVEDKKDAKKDAKKGGKK